VGEIVKNALFRIVVEDSFEKFPDLHPDAGNFHKLILSSLSKVTSVVKLS